MYQYLHKYLVLHQKLSLPEIGTFSIESVASQVDKINGLIYAPTPSIRFTQGPPFQPDRGFYQFLAQEMNIDEVTSIRRFHNYLYEINANLEYPKGSTIQGIGHLQKVNYGYIVFTPEKNLQDLVPPVKMESEPTASETSYSFQEDAALSDHINDISVNNSIEDNTNHIEEDTPQKSIIEIVQEEYEMNNIIEHKDYWWVYALIFIIIGIGGLYYYYNYF
jgi:hypothetical protein